MVERVLITEKAKAVVDELRQQHSLLIFHQSGGCCDGSSPMCYPDGELLLDDSDIFLGTVHECKFYMSRDQYDYWKHTQLTVDIVQGRGSSFSLEIPLGVRFMIRSRIFSKTELDELNGQKVDQ